MNRLIRALMPGLVICLLAGCAQATIAPTPAFATQTAAAALTSSPPGLILIAKTFVDQMVAGNFDAAVSRFNDTMKSAMPAENLKASWQQLVAQVGKFNQQIGTQTLDAQNYRVVLVACEFATAQLYVQITFDDQSRIAGVYFVPMPVPTTVK